MINGTKFVVMFEKGKFLCTFRKMESVVEQYNRDLAEWEYQVSRKPTATAKEQHRPPAPQWKYECALYPGSHGKAPAVL